MTKILLFKTSIDNSILIKLFQETCIKSEIDNSYIFNNDSYKKGIFNQTIPQFIETCKEHYAPSKQHYVERKMTYNYFITILRQICNHNKIKYTSKILYDKSDYNITYYFYPITIDDASLT
jgi:hypothetical protein